MKNNRYVLLIVGKSGSGKSALCNYMEKTYGLKQVKSYTTRLCRGLEDNTHTFVTDEEFDKLTDMCAYTVFDGNRYCATSKQVDECDLYVIDPTGIDYFLREYRGIKIPIVIHIDASESICTLRMYERGDDPNDISRRIKHDRKAFKNVREYATETYNNTYNDEANLRMIGDLLYEKYFTYNDEATLRMVSDLMYEKYFKVADNVRKTEEVIEKRIERLDTDKYHQLKELCEAVADFLDDNFTQQTEVTISHTDFTVKEKIVDGFVSL